MRNRHCNPEGQYRGWRRFGPPHEGRGPEGRHEGRGMHRRHGGPHRLARFFEHGDLRLVALQLISEKPRHGYEIIKAIEEKSGGAYTPSAGAVYPTLTLLQELGQLTVTDGADGRKLHTITEEGQAALTANRKTVDTIFTRIAQTGAAAGDAPAPLLGEALHRLKHALRLRLSRGPLDETQAKDIAEKLDAASAAIENS
jgi:DNA-binding PadR family transcriptional regulator